MLDGRHESTSPDLPKRSFQEYLSPSLPPPLQCLTCHTQAQAQFMDQFVRNARLHGTQQIDDEPRIDPSPEKSHPFWICSPPASITTETLACCRCRRFQLHRSTSRFAGGSKRCEGHHHRNCYLASAPDLPSQSQSLKETEKSWAAAESWVSWRDLGKWCCHAVLPKFRSLTPRFVQIARWNRLSVHHAI